MPTPPTVGTWLTCTKPFIAATRRGTTPVEAGSQWQVFSVEGDRAVLDARQAPQTIMVPTAELADYVRA
jgi:hypothetical protein